MVTKSGTDIKNSNEKDQSKIKPVTDFIDNMDDDEQCLYAMQQPSFIDNLHLFM